MNGHAARLLAFVAMVAGACSDSPSRAKLERAWDELWSRSKRPQPNTPDELRAHVDASLNVSVERQRNPTCPVSADTSGHRADCFLSKQDRAHRLHVVLLSLMERRGMVDDACRKHAVTLALEGKRSRWPELARLCRDEEDKYDAFDERTRDPNDRELTAKYQASLHLVQEDVDRLLHERFPVRTSTPWARALTAARADMPAPDPVEAPTRCPGDIEPSAECGADSERVSMRIAAAGALDLVRLSTYRVCDQKAERVPSSRLPALARACVGLERDLWRRRLALPGLDDHALKVEEIKFNLVTDDEISRVLDKAMQGERVRVPEASEAPRP